MSQTAITTVDSNNECAIIFIVFSLKNQFESVKINSSAIAGESSTIALAAEQSVLPKAVATESRLRGPYGAFVFLAARFLRLDTVQGELNESSEANLALPWLRLWRTGRQKRPALSLVRAAAWIADTDQHKTREFPVHLNTCQQRDLPLRPLW